MRHLVIMILIKNIRIVWKNEIKRVILHFRNKYCSFV